MKDDRKIAIFDTTLRDGQQCPGAGMSLEHNLEYAELVALLRVDVVEAGFPSASAVDYEIVNAIAKHYAQKDDSPTVAALCQLRDEQIDCTIESIMPLQAVERARLHTYVPVSPELMKASLGSKADKIIITQQVYDYVKRAVDAGLEVEFSPEGYSKQGENFDFVTDLIVAAIEAGARVINCPDTIGGGCLLEGEEYFVRKLSRHAEIIAERYPDISICWSAHCHNDFGLAVQNSINSVFDGPCRQIEGCFNGVGERAGNAALESVIMIIRQFASVRDNENPLYTGIDITHLQKVCDFVSAHMLPRQPHWPVSGANAAKHSSGGHTNAVLKDPLAYQPFDPREIGKPITFAFGPLSGGNHAKSIIEDNGYTCSNAEKAQVAQYIKDFYKERRKGVTDEELMIAYRGYRSPIVIEDFAYSRGSSGSQVQLRGKLFERSGDIVEIYDGPDSALAALKQASDSFFPVTIQSHKSQSASSGVDAKSVSTIFIEDKSGSVYEGVGEDSDIEISAMKAFIAAVNTAYIESKYVIRRERLL